MSIPVIDKIVSIGDFPVADASDIQMGDFRIDEVINNTVSKIPAKTSQLQNDSGYLTQHQSLAEYAKKSEIPTVPSKISAFENDKGYLTQHQSLAEYAKKSEIPTKTSQLQNDSGYLTQHQSLAEYAKKSEIPTVPTTVSSFTNDAGYLTQHQDISGLASKSSVTELSGKVSANESKINRIESKNAYQYHTVNEMKSDTNLKSGDICYSLGYASDSDNGGSYYIVSSESHGYSITLNNGLYANKANNFTRVESYGVLPSNSDNTAALTNAYNYTKVLEFGSGTFNFSGSVVFTDTVTLRGANRDKYGSGAGITKLVYNGEDCFIKICGTLSDDSAPGDLHKERTFKNINEGCILENLVICGESSSNRGLCGLQLIFAPTTKVNNVSFKYFKIAIYQHLSWSTTYDSINIDACWIGLLAYDSGGNGLINVMYIDGENPNPYTTQPITDERVLAVYNPEGGLYETGIIINGGFFCATSLTIEKIPSAIIADDGRITVQSLHTEIIHKYHYVTFNKGQIVVDYWHFYNNTAHRDSVQIVKMDNTDFNIIEVKYANVEGEGGYAALKGFSDYTGLGYYSIMADKNYPYTAKVPFFFKSKCHLLHVQKMQTINEWEDFDMTFVDGMLAFDKMGFNFWAKITINNPGKYTTGIYAANSELTLASDITYKATCEDGTILNGTLQQQSYKRRYLLSDLGPSAPESPIVEIELWHNGF